MSIRTTNSFAIAAVCSTFLTATLGYGQTAVDTGDFVLGNRDFSRYVTPLMCVEAAGVTAIRLSATIEAQAKSEVMRYTPFLDTMPVGVTAIARTCGAHFTAQDPLFTGTYGLDNLKAWFALSLLAIHDALVDTIQTRMLNSATKPGERDRVSLWAIDQYLRARPIRLGAAKALAANLDSSGSARMISRVLAHDRLLSLADTAFERTMMHDEAERVMTLSAEPGFTENELCWVGVGAMLHAYTTEMSVAVIDHPDSLAGLHDFISRLQARFRQPAMQHCVELRKNTMFPLPDFSQMNVPDIVDKMLSETVGLVSILPEKIEKQTLVTGPKWFSVPNMDARVPVPNKVSMIVFLPTDIGWPEGYKRVNMVLRRWISRYGNAGLSVAVLAAPHGHVLWGATETSEQLSKSIDWYYHQYVRLPVTVGFDSASRLSPIPAPDNRIHYGPSALEDAWRISYAQTTNGSPNYWYRNDGLVILVDRSGNIIYRTEFPGSGGFGLSPVLETLLVRAFPTH